MRVLLDKSHFYENFAYECVSADGAKIRRRRVRRV